MISRITPRDLVLWKKDEAEPAEHVLRRLRALEGSYGSRIPALALTAHARAQDCEQAFLAGFEAHLAKPVALERMLAVLESVLAGRPR